MVFDGIWVFGMVSIDPHWCIQLYDTSLYTDPASAAFDDPDAKTRSREERKLEICWEMRWKASSQAAGVTYGNYIIFQQGSE